MEFIDEETRPRFLFQSRSTPPPSNPQPPTPSLHKPSLLISLPLSTLIFSLSLLFPQPEPLQSLLLWLSFSLLLGPFAPSSLTAGDIRVGRGKLIESPPKPLSLDLDDSKKKTPNRRSRPRKPDELGFNPGPEAVEYAKNGEDLRESPQLDGNDKLVVEGGGEREWEEGDYEVLKKLLVKHPVGKPKRWEAIAEGFKGRHGVESVIKAAKSMGERKTSDSDSFARFLKDRKPVDKRVVEEEGGEGAAAAADGGELMRESVIWSGADDVALLNALKAFPKDAPMRWEKIAAAVPGKSKAGCMKRVAELKKGFRSSKASAEIL